ncbi:MAG TPA: DUF1508 domain-containing protein [Oceanospirillales bacterium]|nr:DUF1508 domain-containing protein [Oceanospirillaceae bacterium]HBS41735.1 DUF1508 domain-containing protein [Oceanospirillales bacterium]|tara:strand:+ start:2733 stop:3062 length:330 start_codon:yes stop_codon:yes gene_type:complete
MPFTFEISPAEQGLQHFRLLDGQGNTLILGGEYETKELTESVIQKVRVGSMMSQFIAKCATPDGGMFFVIKDESGTVLAKSELFENEMDFNNTLHKVRESACIAQISYS